MKPTNINLIPNTINPTPDYYCTWQTQLFATCDGKPEGQRKAINEQSLFDSQKPYGWAYFYEQAREDLLLVMDDSWDVPLNGDEGYYGSLVLSKDKFPSFYKGNTLALKALTDKIKALGWKGLGGWVCAQESPLFADNKTAEEYWIDRLKEMHAAGLSYWKVDWGSKCRCLAFRKMLTELGRLHAPNLWIEHAKIKESLPHADVFRTYDVPAIMSIPMTLEKIQGLADVPAALGENKGLINCEDEAYIAAAGGFAMGIMRHPYAGAFENGKADMSFPEMHRNLKTKMHEVLRAARWHRLAPAFSGGSFEISETLLSDTWQFENKQAEMESWWFESPLIGNFLEGNMLTKSAPAAIARNTSLPVVTPDSNGIRPYCVASRHPNGVYSLATLGRTIGRSYCIPKCDVTIKTASADTIGIFGEYRSLRMETDINICTVLIQDIADDTAYDITDSVEIEHGILTISGELIRKFGTLSQPKDDTSEPGAVLKLNS